MCLILFMTGNLKVSLDLQSESLPLLSMRYLHAPAVLAACPCMSCLHDLAPCACMSCMHQKVPANAAARSRHGAVLGHQ